MIIITKMKLPIIVGALFGMIPDLEHLLVDFGIMEQQVFISHVPWFPHGEWALPGGLVVQVVVIFLCLAICCWIRKASDRQY